MRKSSPLRPTRGWRKNTGPRVSSLIANAIAVISGESRISAAEDAAKSKTLLTSCDERLIWNFGMPKRASPGSWSISNDIEAMREIGGMMLTLISDRLRSSTVWRISSAVQEPAATMIRCGWSSSMNGAMRSVRA